MTTMVGECKQTTRRQHSVFLWHVVYVQWGTEEEEDVESK